MVATDKRTTSRRDDKGEVQPGLVMADKEE